VFFSRIRPSLADRKTPPRPLGLNADIPCGVFVLAITSFHDVLFPFFAFMGVSCARDFHERVPLRDSGIPIFRDTVLVFCLLLAATSASQILPFCRLSVGIKKVTTCAVTFPFFNSRVSLFS
jgi:hypothetical protein